MADDPRPGQYGKRVFPDAPTPPPDPPYQEGFRRKVDLLVKLAVKTAGRRVAMRVYDVEDPSRMDPRNETNHVNNPENILTSLEWPQVASDANGEIRIACTLTTLQQIDPPCPGDNFRIAVAPRATDLDRVKPLVFAKSQTSELFYDKNDDGMFVPGDGDCVMNENSGWGDIRVSPLLTVWRRLHVEYDSMGAVKDNTVVAEVQEILVLEDEEEIIVKLHPGEHLPLEEGRFAGGYLLDNSGARF